MKKFAALFLVLILCLGLCACGSSGAASSSGSAKLVLGTSADYKPFEFMYPNDKGELVYGGIDVSVAQFIADSTGKELQIENMSFDYLLASLQKGDFDIVIAAMEATDERKQSADFSDPYYTDVPAMILVRAAEADQYTGMDSFAGKSVGAQTATTKEDIVKDDLTGANLVSLAVVDDLINQLVHGKIDAVVLDGGVALAHAASNPDLAVCSVALGEAEPYCVAVAKGDPKGLLPGINEAIAKMIEQGLIEQYIEAAEALDDVAQEVSAE